MICKGQFLLACTQSGNTLNDLYCFYLFCIALYINILHFLPHNTTQLNPCFVSKLCPTFRVQQTHYFCFFLKAAAKVHFSSETTKNYDKFSFYLRKFKKSRASFGSLYSKLPLSRSSIRSLPVRFEPTHISSSCLALQVSASLFGLACFSTM